MPRQINPVPGVKRECRCPRVKHQHGDTGMYDHDRCRCLECRAAVRLRRRRNYRRACVNRWAGRSQVMDATGTRRRLQALSVRGHSALAMATELGMEVGHLKKIRRGCRTTVNRATAERIAALYERWSLVVPAGQAANLARAHAARQGWAPPLAWDDDAIDDPAGMPYTAAASDDAELLDEVAIEEALRGQRPVKLTRAERKEAVRRARVRGMSPQQTADALRVLPRLVQRDLAEMGFTGDRRAVMADASAA